MGAASGRSSGRIFQAASLVIILLFLSPAQADTLTEPDSAAEGTSLNFLARNLPRTPRDFSAFDNRLAATVYRTSDDGPFSDSLRLEANIFVAANALDLPGSATEFAPPVLPVGGVPIASDARGSLPGVSFAQTAKNQAGVPVTQFTRIPEPSIVILAGVGFAVALFGRKRGRAAAHRN